MFREVEKNGFFPVLKEDLKCEHELSIEYQPS